MIPRFLAAFAVALATTFAAVPVRAAGPALVFDVETSRILYAEAPDQPWYPASLTKLMTAYMVFDALEREAVTAKAQIVISLRANAQPKTRVGLGGGKRITVGEALAGLVIHSANDLAMALAEAVSGTEEDFVAEMNEMAFKLGMLHTRFANSNGLPGEGQATTARDMAILARALLRDFPQWNYLYAEESEQVGHKTVSTHNDVLKNFDGGDGMKTGFTCGAGYNVVASATRGGRRIVAVVLGDRTSRARTSRAEDLLEKAFQTRRGGPEGASLIDPEPVSGEALIDAPHFSLARPAFELMKIRNCWPPAPKIETASADDQALQATAGVNGGPDQGPANPKSAPAPEKPAKVSANKVPAKSETPVKAETKSR
jgi:D-alanyl-D-alanine carboxypeptidase